MSEQNSIWYKYPGAEQTSAITLVVCTSRVERYWEHIVANRRALGPHDVALCVVDSVLQDPSGVLDELEAAGVVAVCHGCNLGLSASRNRALSLCQTRYLLFVDDDATITAEAIGAIRTAFADGAGVVGTRLSSPSGLRVARWFLSYGQYHYLALHRPDRPISAWGACMGVDMSQVRRHGLAFRHELGRRGEQLESGDDTAFLRALAEAGARVRLLGDVVCTHHIAAERLRFSYLLRRAWWQGRSEVRRSNCAAGFLKELRRNLDAAATSPLRLFVGLIYTGAVAAGVVVELASHGASRMVARA